MYVSSVYLCVFVCEHVNVPKYVFVPVFLSLCLSKCVCMYPDEYVFVSVTVSVGGGISGILGYSTRAKLVTCTF